MHSNTLDASSPNLSDDWRRNIIIAVRDNLITVPLALFNPLAPVRTQYNSRHNEPLPGAPEGQPHYNKVDVVPDTNILKVGVKGIDVTKNKMLAQ